MQFSDFWLKHASLDETENKQADRKKKPKKKEPKKPKPDET